MSGTLIVNNLAGLMMFTSLLVIGTKRPLTACWLYALQSLVLVLIFFVLARTLHAHSLLLWAGSALLTKVILVPLIMAHTLRRLNAPQVEGNLLSPALMVILSALIALLCVFVVAPIQLPLAEELKPALAVSLGHFLLGLVCIVAQRNIVKQIFGYCLMENGSHLTLALLAWQAPELVEIGVATDAIFAVIVLTVLVRSIYSKLHTLDVSQLTTLKG